MLTIISGATRDQAQFYTAAVCFQDARRYIAVIANERGFDADLGLAVLDQFGRIVEQVDRSVCSS